ncbi:hypothetical protein C0J52_18519 [Blattella germanica]|nr:hypothetical protein C0J52_18519 [Blattella germanica]PSN48386.1 hypothetical protein C0J52_18519 [Blattella germanica]
MFYHFPCVFPVLRVFTPVSDRWFRYVIPLTVQLDSPQTKETQNIIEIFSPH